MYRQNLSEKEFFRTSLLGLAVSCRYMSAGLQATDHAGSAGLYGVGVVVMTFAITPTSFWKAMWKVVAKGIEWASVVFSFMYGLLEKGLNAAVRLWAFLQVFIFEKIINQPAMLWLYRALLEPLWNIR